MAETIRTVRTDEFEGFMRFLERCYGHSRNFFPEVYPHLYNPSAEACRCCHVVERDGRIVSHVGIYPVRLLEDGVRVAAGGIGGVCTDPAERGRKQMSRLLLHAIDVMRAEKYLISGLGGDRQRYASFGWDNAGITYRLSFSRRSLDRAGVSPIGIEETTAEKILPAIEEFSRHRKARCERPRLDLQLRARGYRFWIAPDGFAVTRGEGYDDVRVVDFATVPGSEAGLMLAMISLTSNRSANAAVPSFEGELLSRLMPAVSGWSSGPDWQYRIIDLPGLMEAFQPLLQRRAEGVQDFDVSVGMREHDRVQVVAVALDGGRVRIARERRPGRYVEMDPLSAVRTLLGGPPTAASLELSSDLGRLLPLPVHFLGMDHV